MCNYPLTDCEPAAAFLRSCFFNFAVTVEGFMTISVNRVATHIGLPRNQLPASCASEAELSSVQMGWVWCQSMAYRHVYDLIFKMWLGLHKNSLTAVF